jgi:microcystin-dependent protein
LHPAHPAAHNYNYFKSVAKERLVSMNVACARVSHLFYRSFVLGLCALAGAARAATLDGTLTVSNTLTATTNAIVLGNAGVGTTNPAYRLDVAGDINLTGDLLKNGEPLSLGGAGGVSNVTATAPLASSGGSEPNLSIETAGATQAGALSAADWTRFDAAHGWGNHAAAGYLTNFTESDPAFTASPAAGITADSTNEWSAKVGGSGTAGYLPKFTAAGTVGDSALFSDTEGKVGIGTATPGYKLDVAGSINGAAITINGTPVATSQDTYWSTAGGGAIQYSGGNVGIGTAIPAASAALEVTATDKGMLIPRMTKAQRDLIASPAAGLLVYQTDNTPGFYFYDGAQWSSISAGAGAVTAVSATSPLSSSGGSTPTLSLPAATSSQNGYLTSANWTTFNGKESTLTFSSPLSRSVNTISLPVATASANGYLSSTDWATFNAKAPTNRTISTTVPLSGGGALSGNLTLSMPVATNNANGYLSSNDWATFNAKVPTNRAISTAAPLTGGGLLTNNLTLSMPVATNNANGYLSSNNWVTFNAKESALTFSTPLSRSVNTITLGVVSVANGGSGTNALTAGKILVGNGTASVLAPANLHWDNTNSRLGVGDTTPSYAVDVAGDVNVTGTVRVAGVSIATPVGVVQQYAGSNAPAGFLLCDGSAVSRTTYAALFAVISTTYGAGDGATTFNLPNLKGRIPVGRDVTQTEFDVLGETGGAKTHTLTTNEIPAHAHQVDPPSSTTSTSGAHTHGYRDYFAYNTYSDDANDRLVGSTLTYRDTTTDSDGDHAHTLDIVAFNSGAAGAGGAHNNLQPYIVLNYIIKY